jgi:drug/metabolite transporter (DMT)-like permease
MSIYKIPGPLLIALGGLFLSSGGTIFRSFEMIDPWAIYFWRSIFFTPSVLLFVYLTTENKSDIAIKFKQLGWAGIVCAILLATGSGSYMFALKYTTVANVVFIISVQTFFLAVAGYFFLQEKINTSTAVAILLAATGLYIMIGTKISGGTALGNALAFVIPTAFTAVVILIRTFKHIDMVPAVAVSGLFAAVAGFLFSGSIAISMHDLILVFFFGALQYAPGFICLTLGSRTTPSAKIGIFAFTEALAGPIWAWIFVQEVPPLGVLIGGAIIFLAILLKSFKS